MKLFDKDKIIIGILILIFAIYGIWGNFQNKNNQNLENDLSINNSLEELDDNEVIFIHIDGEVENPGMYEMKRSHRVNDAINAANGLTKEASIKNINLAQKLVDEMKIYIPRENSDIVDNSNKGNPENNLININIASKEELKSLPGIGETKAEAIIKYRESSGFNKLEDLMNVSGIGEKTFESLKEFISIY